LQYYHLYSKAIKQNSYTFPTRRSSDLIAMHHATSEPALNTLKFRPSAITVLGHRPAACATTATASSARHSLRCCPGVGQRARPKDRKSTRLNSSHVKISYAVFCLKKII